MLKPNFKTMLVVPALAAVGLGVPVGWNASDAWAAGENGPARVLRHTRNQAESYSAIVLRASELPKGIVSRDHVIMIDTSASQVGAHRQHGFAVLEALLASLPETDRVQLFAVDVTAESLFDGFVSPRHASVREGLDQLQSRVPLGATNLHAALTTAMRSIEKTVPSDITYIGDGMSTADLIESSELRSLLTDLRKQRIPVNSYGVGPDTNLHLLGILAHQTGGSISFDAGLIGSATKTQITKSSLDEAATRGKALASSMKSPVYFPTTMTISPTSASLLPTEPLPMRTDRETIYVTSSQLPANTKLTLSDNDSQDASMEWSMSAPVEQSSVAFLGDYVRRVEAEGGFSNSLAGTPMMMVAQDYFAQQMAAMVGQAETALKRGDLRQAAHLVDLVAKADPANHESQSLAKAVNRLQVQLVKHQGNEASGDPKAEGEGGIQPNSDDSLLERQQQEGLVKTQKLQNQVSSSIERSRKSDDPAAALADLKQALNSVKSAIDVAPDTRLRLQKTLEGEIELQRNQQEQKQQNLIRAFEARSQLEAQERLNEQARLDEERLEQLIDRVRSLMLEGRHGRDEAFGEAQEVADVAINLRPGDGTSAAARFDSEAAQQLRRADRLRARRADQFLETLHQVELSHVPFPDEPPVRFPPAEIWKSLSERRRKWAQVDLTKDSPNEAKIKSALTQTTEVNFADMPLEEAIKYLKELHGIEIWLDKEALSTDGISTDQQISLALSGITLRSALRLLLEPLQLTYIIEDEVMKITTKVAADEKMSTRVYPVADLVVPIISGGGGFGGQQGGGQQGGGFGGQQGGGGFGGGGGGFGGGGGGFGNVAPEALAPKKNNAVAPGQPVPKKEAGRNDAKGNDLLKKKQPHRG